MIAYGLAMGGVAAIKAAGLYQEIAGMISIAAYSSWGDLFSDNLYFSDASLLFALAEKPFAKLCTLFKFGWSRRKITPQRQMGNLGSRPMLLMHCEGDQQILFLNLRRLIRAGSEHFFCLNFLEPEQDLEYLQGVLEFLENNFPGKEKI